MASKNSNFGHFRVVPVGCPTILKGPGGFFTSRAGAVVLSKLLPNFPGVFMRPYNCRQTVDNP